MIKFKTRYFFVLAFLVISCNTNNKTDKSTTIKLLDSVQTKSGLQYFYVQQGKGRKVEPGSKVGAYLSLMVNDSVIWDSYGAKDSMFSFIADRGGVIKGYNEMVMLLREGDAVVAILPDSIAYGQKGSGKVIPPGATLVYDTFKIGKVSEPKFVLSDTLFHMIKNQNMNKMIAKYQSISSTKDSANYHGGTDQLKSLWRKLSKANMHQEGLEMARYFKNNVDDLNIKIYEVLSLESLGNIKGAIKQIDILIKENPDTRF